MTKWRGSLPVRLLKAVAGGAGTFGLRDSGVDEGERVEGVFRRGHPLACFSLDCLHGNGDGP